MTAQYWVAKYVDDPIRNEPRNVGVVTLKDGAHAARFLGERDDGQFDARHLGNKLRYAQVYGQWRSYWREQIKAGNLAGLMSASPNYFIIEGGEVVDSGEDTAQQVCQFLYSMLVSPGGALEAYGWTVEEEPEVELDTELTTAFNDLRVLAVGGTLLTRHPIRARQSIQGQHVAHVPSFSQRNGSLYVFEHIDLSVRNVIKTKERAGWMAYMFSDIREANETAKAYSIVRPADESATEAISYARSVLNGESEVVNWTDLQERGRFLEERERVAELA